ncbi:MAG: histidinol-phosphatase [Clostridia bacterium]|nr:histidinol-phosphatase [Clostridia bacterium]
MTIDFHAHILPEVDHGSKSLEESLSQLALIKGNSDKIVATPHFYPSAHKLDSFISKVDNAISLLKENSATYSGLDISVGAEVLICDYLDRFDGIEQLCIRGTRCMLLEMPNVGAWSERMLKTVENLLDKDFCVVLAHIDRYFKDYRRELDVLLDMGAKAQINASSLIPFLSRRRAMSYIKDGAVYAFGSDLHRALPGSYGNFMKIESTVGTELYEAVMCRTAELIKNAQII